MRDVKVTQAAYACSAVSPDQYPKDRLPEIALVGRSNVGKSSFINKMVNRHKLAHTSSAPGKTRTLNFYRINNRFYFVDFPGYGFAKVSKEERAKWAAFIEEYLTSRRFLVGVVHIVDLRHPPTADDKLMADWLRHAGLPTVVVATKADKVSRGQWPKHVKAVREGLGLNEEVPVVVFSAETGEGKDKVWGLLLDWVDAFKPPVV